MESFSAFFDALYEHYGRGGAWRAYPEAEETLRAMRARGCRTAVISNFDSRLMNILRALELDHYFDLVTYSSASGAAKPESAIFAPHLVPASESGRKRPCTPATTPAPTWRGHAPPVFTAFLIDRRRSEADAKGGVIATLRDLEAWFAKD